jgi:hypothetical protein
VSINPNLNPDEIHHVDNQCALPRQTPFDSENLYRQVPIIPPVEGAAFDRKTNQSWTISVLR